ncbi:TPA: ead/Ea22-like family protein, partial [Escherichia coli]
MSEINYQALREVAEKALHGEWSHEAGAIWNTCDSGYVQHMTAVEAGDDVSDEEHMSNMRFITLATPTVVLGLLDELSEAKAAEENESSCANSVIDIAINWQMRAKDAEAKLEAAEKRIAELEAREVALPVASCIVEDGCMCVDGFSEYVGHSLPDGAHQLYTAPPAPVVPDDWQLVPKKITLEMECALSKADSYEIGWLWALAAAPKYEVQNAKRVQNALNTCRAAMLQSQGEGNPHVTPALLPGGFTIEDAKELHEDLVRSHISQALSGEKMKKKDRDADLRWIHGVIVQAAWFV